MTDKKFCYDQLGQHDSSEESFLSDADIFASLRNGKAKRRRLFHKFILVLSIGLTTILISTILIEYQAVVYAREVKQLVGNCFDFGHINNRTAKHS